MISMMHQLAGSLQEDGRETKPSLLATRWLMISIMQKLTGSLQTDGRATIPWQVATSVAHDIHEATVGRKPVGRW